MRKFTIALILVTLAVAAASSTASADGTAPSVWTDPAGDAASAPDLAKLTLAPGTGTVGVDLTFGGALDSDSSFLFLIDADRNPASGSQGFDYAVVANQTGAAFLKWNGTTWDGDSFTHQPLAPNLTSTDLTFTITLSDIGGVSTFDFVAGSVHGNDVDTVPDGGSATYPATSTPDAPAPTIKSVLVPGTVLLPKAGRVLRVARLQVTLTDDSIVAATSQTCTLSYKGKKLPALAGGCAWKIPVADKKKRLVLTIHVAYDGDARVVTLPIVPS